MKLSELGKDWFRAYEYCVRHYKTREAAAIAKHYRPQKLYKYYSFESMYWEENTFKSELAFNLPEDFNDPLDSRWFLDYETILRERFRDIGEDWSTSLIGDDSSFQSMIQLYEEDLMPLRNMFCLCCFSKTPSSNLMWGHYANKHTGFCLEYDVSRFPKECQVVLPVIYTEEPFDASMILDMRGIEDKYAALSPLLFKSKDWSYEKEWRAIISNDGGTIPIIKSVPGAISGVYLGLNAYGDNRNKLEEWADNNGIPAYQMERSYLSFDLIFELTSDIKANRSSKGFIV